MRDEREKFLNEKIQLLGEALDGVTVWEWETIKNAIDDRVFGAKRRAEIKDSKKTEKVLRRYLNVKEDEKEEPTNN